METSSCNDDQGRRKSSKLWTLQNQKDSQMTHFTRQFIIFIIGWSMSHNWIFWVIHRPDLQWSSPAKTSEPLKPSHVRGPKKWASRLIICIAWDPNCTMNHLNIEYGTVIVFALDDLWMVDLWGNHWSSNFVEEINISIVRFFHQKICMSVCMYICICKCVCVCECVCVCACMYVRTYVCIHVCLSVCMSVPLYLCFSACLHVCMPVCLYVCMSVWTDGWMDGRTYGRICMYACVHLRMDGCMDACM